jgi:hypothetical protein
MKTLGDSRSGAIFSDDMKYRYRLWRRWNFDSEGGVCVFCMLNPSTANESFNDPTVERCERRARDLGFGSLEVVNIFALRSTDPQALYNDPDPVGPKNDDIIYAVIDNAFNNGGMAVMAWGEHGKLRGRGEAVLDMLERRGTLYVHALKLNRSGQPAHPLYLPYAAQPRGWWLPNGKKLDPIKRREL